MKTKTITINLAGVELTATDAPVQLASLAHMFLRAAEAGIHQEEPGPLTLNDGELHAVSELLQAGRTLFLELAS